MMAPKLEQLRSMSTSELDELYERTAPNVVIGLDFIRREIEWRAQADFSERTERMTKSMEEMTREIRDMTKKIQHLAIAAVVFSVASIAISLWL